MYKILKVDGSTIYLGGANEEMITVDKDSFNYENPKVGDAVQVFKNDDSMIVAKTDSAQEQNRMPEEIMRSNENAFGASAKKVKVKTEKHAKPLYKKPWFIVLMVILVLWVIGSSAGGDENASSTSVNKNNATEKTQEVKKKEVPQEYKNALNKAQVYSDTMYMSKKGIYKQLTSDAGEGFPEKAAQYAIKHVKANWKENALMTAKSYYEDMSMSKDAIYDQLISEYGEQFTPEQAKYAIEHLD